MAQVSKIFYKNAGNLEIIIQTIIQRFQHNLKMLHFIPLRFINDITLKLERAINLSTDVVCIRNAV